MPTRIRKDLFAVCSLAGGRSNACANDAQWLFFTNNGLVNEVVQNPLMQFFTLGSSKIEAFETCFYDIVLTPYDHPNYVKHVLGRI